MADQNNVIASAVACFLLFILGWFAGKSKPTLKRKQIKDLTNKRKFVLECIKPQKDKYYQLYLKQCVSARDI